MVVGNLILGVFFGTPLLGQLQDGKGNALDLEIRKPRSLNPEMPMLLACH